MVRAVRMTLVAVLAALVAGCAISPGPEARAPQLCEFKRHPLAVEIDDGVGLPQELGSETLADALRADYATAAPQGLETRPVSPSMLILSGGSQKGAFGAGFLNGWATRHKDGLPRVRVVTGISTGAILAPFAFLGETQVMVDYYAIHRERDVLNPFVSSKKMGLSTGLTVARKGAVGDLAPLRAKLRMLIDDTRLKAIAREGMAGRKLYVGAVDLDMGQAVAFDMTDMASKYAAEPDGSAKRQLYRNCFAEAIVASSSVPMAALPVFIDNRMYIDGGARFGVFTDEVGEAVNNGLLTAPANAAAPQSVAAGPNVFVLINGDLTTPARCGKVAGCPGDPWTLAGKHKDWDLLGVADRSVSVLINQVYRFSTDRIVRPGSGSPFTAHLARIRPDAAGFVFEINEPGFAQGRKTCAEWADEDDRVDRPLEFHPRYMRCLIAYGDRRAEESGWQTLD